MEQVLVPRVASDTQQSLSMETVAAPVQLSPRATAEVRKILEVQSIPEGYGLRVGVRGGGCSGMSYILGFDKLREHDLTFDTEGIPIVYR